MVTTVDGRNSAPVYMVNIPLFSWFYTSQVVSRISSGGAGFLNHQQDYHIECRLVWHLKVDRSFLEHKWK